MTTLWSLLSYAVAIFFIVIIGALSELPIFPLIPVLRQAKWLSPLVRVAKETAALVLAVYLLTILAQNTPLRVSILMVLIPFFMNIRNDRKRIANVKAGKSGTLDLMQTSGNADLYDLQNDLYTEYGSFFGHILGFILAFSFLLRGAQFL